MKLILCYDWVLKQSFFKTFISEFKENNYRSTYLETEVSGNISVILPNDILFQEIRSKLYQH